MVRRNKRSLRQQQEEEEEEVEERVWMARCLRTAERRLQADRVRKAGMEEGGMFEKLMKLHKVLGRVVGEKGREEEEVRRLRRVLGWVAEAWVMVRRGGREVLVWRSLEEAERLLEELAVQLEVEGREQEEGEEEVESFNVCRSMQKVNLSDLFVIF